LAKAFTAVVTSFVSEILLPILSLLPFIKRNFDEWFAVLSPGRGYGEGKHRGYNTLRQALDDGAVVMAYGYVVIFFFRFVWLFRWAFGGCVVLVLLLGALKGENGCLRG